MIAEIRHKVSSDYEDELTGHFFGNMRYIPFTRGLKRILVRCMRGLGASELERIQRIEEDEFEFSFWRRSELDGREIDGLLEVENIGIGVEVKYYSPLSGGDQLEREAAMLGEWCRTKEKYLLLVALSSDARDIYERNKEKACFRDVHLAYMTWQDICDAMDEVLTESGYEERIVGDLKNLLIEKGFATFNGFTDLGVKIDGGRYYDFR